MKNIIHIGFPKNASTTLQHNVFIKTTKYQYVGKPLNQYSGEFHNFLRELIYGSIDNFKNSSGVWMKDFLEKKRNGKPVLLSEEEIATSALNSKCSPDDILSKLEILLPDSDILLITRRMAGCVESLYAYMLAYNIISPLPFKAFCQQYLTPVLQRYTLDKKLASYSRVFGQDSVSIIDLEKKQDMNPLVKLYLKEDLEDERVSLNERLGHADYLQLMSKHGFKENQLDCFINESGKLTFGWRDADLEAVNIVDSENYESMTRYRVL